jgi:hypothetical protein
MILFERFGQPPGRLILAMAASLGWNPKGAFGRARIDLCDGALARRRTAESNTSRPEDYF